MDNLSLASPAKINIGLNVINKREDGFHNIETIFYPLLLADSLSFSKSDTTNFDTNSDEIRGLDSNLILMAKKLIERYCKKNFPLNIFLDKKIPTGAGLGGGSSNAAATIKAINILYHLGLSHSILSSIGLELGSDVPYFLNQIPSFAASRGEVLKRINLSLSHPILIIYPGIHISTKWAFSKIELRVSESKLKNIKESNNISIDEIKQFAINDFEEVVFNKFPEIKNIKEILLQSGADYASMTGTGSAIYGIFSNLQTARRAQESFGKDHFTYLNYPVDKGSIT